MTIIQRIDALCDEKKIRRKTLADALGVPASTLHTWIQRGEDLPARYVVPVCKVLGVTPAYLLTGEDVSGVPAECDASPEASDARFLLSVVKRLDREGRAFVIGKAIEEARRLDLPDASLDAHS